MKKTRRFVALLLAAVLALALFTACGAAQPTIGEQYEKWFVEDLYSKLPEGKTVQRVDVKHSDMMAALAKIDKDGKIKVKDCWAKEFDDTETSRWIIISRPMAWFYTRETVVNAVELTSENVTDYGLDSFMGEERPSQIKSYDIATLVKDGKTYVAVYLCFKKRK